MNNFRLIITLVSITVSFSCQIENHAQKRLNEFKQYYTTLKLDSEAKWNFTTDTVRVWFDDKTNMPIKKIRGKKAIGKWKEWDEEMNSSSIYDTIWYNKSENSIQGYFYENNDFYELIGKKPTKTLRTYWLNKDNKINEILIYWIPEQNTTTSKHLKPIVEWALLNDSTEINQLYPNNRIIPSRKNAERWRKLLTRYNLENRIRHN